MILNSSLQNNVTTLLIQCRSFIILRTGLALTINVNAWCFEFEFEFELEISVLFISLLIDAFNFKPDSLDSLVMSSMVFNIKHEICIYTFSILLGL